MSHPPVLRISDIDSENLNRLFQGYGLTVVYLSAFETVPGSYWGESEAGLIGNTLYVRCDTPLHSALHEGCHYICMDAARRAQLARDAGGDDAEESAVCYLQILLADHLQATNRERMQKDMDAWGYSFRLGSSQAWFEHDALDARAWLIREGLIDNQEGITWRCR
ncbi:MAG: hypothetical protein H7Y02_11285 [Candidatus Obscuribacterales bacterium]|nr:hypothetical protein [Steroidobacteraceae bacterium]